MDQSEAQKITESIGLSIDLERQDHYFECYGKDAHTWEYGPIEHLGVYALGEVRDGGSSVTFLGVSVKVPCGEGGMCWHSYIGPIPQFTKDVPDFDS